MSPAQTPSRVNGSISRCVLYLLECDKNVNIIYVIFVIYVVFYYIVISFSYTAISASLSSFTSRYSIIPSFKKSSNVLEKEKTQVKIEMII